MVIPESHILNYAIVVVIVQLILKGILSDMKTLDLEFNTEQETLVEIVKHVKKVRARLKYYVHAMMFRK